MCDCAEWDCEVLQESVKGKRELKFQIERENYMTGEKTCPQEREVCE